MIHPKKYFYIWREGERLLLVFCVHMLHSYYTDVIMTVENNGFSLSPNIFNFPFCPKNNNNHVRIQTKK